VQEAAAVLEAGEFELAGQFGHTLKPVVPAYVPTPQAEHKLSVEAPMYDEAFPYVHGVHAPAPPVEYVPTPQFVHTLLLLAPVLLEYVPAQQFMQL
jgi:hypothetical protein